MEKAVDRRFSQFSPNIMAFPPLLASACRTFLGPGLHLPGMMGAAWSKSEQLAWVTWILMRLIRRPRISPQLIAGGPV